MSVALANDERLYDPLFLDGIGEFTQGFGGEMFSRLERAGVNAIQRHSFDTLAGRKVGRVSARRFRGSRGWLRRAPEQCAQPAAQCWFCHSLRVAEWRSDVNSRGWR